MTCIVCGSAIEYDTGNQGPICDLCRDRNPFATDRARMIEAAGEPTPEEEMLWEQQDLEEQEREVFAEHERTFYNNL